MAAKQNKNKSSIKAEPISALTTKEVVVTADFQRRYRNTLNHNEEYIDEGFSEYLTRAESRKRFILNSPKYSTTSQTPSQEEFYSYYFKNRFNHYLKQPKKMVGAGIYKGSEQDEIILFINAHLDDEERYWQKYSPHENWKDKIYKDYISWLKKKLSPEIGKKGITVTGIAVALAILNLKNHLISPSKFYKELGEKYRLSSGNIKTTYSKFFGNKNYLKANERRDEMFKHDIVTHERLKVAREVIVEYGIYNDCLPLIDKYEDTYFKIG